MRILVYTGHAPVAIMGLPVIEPDVPFDVPDELADAILKNPRFLELRPSAFHETAPGTGLEGAYSDPAAVAALETQEDLTPANPAPEIPTEPPAAAEPPAEPAPERAPEPSDRKRR